MKITCIQMDVQFCRPEENFRKAAKLIAEAMADEPDVLVLPELWNTGFFPKDNLSDLCDREGVRVKKEIGALAKKFGVNIVAGSVASYRENKLYNTCYVFDRAGQSIADYDKTHLFSPMGEDRFFTPGDHTCHFQLDGIHCGVIICYDLRFPELSRTLALEDISCLFMAAQWPTQRIEHLQTLCAARAIENQLFLVCCNGCGTANETVYGGHSAIYAPDGKVLCRAGTEKAVISADLNLSKRTTTRKSIDVFADRRPELYRQ